VQPGAGGDHLGDGLVERDPRGRGTGSDVGHPDQLEDLAQRAVLPGLAVQEGYDAVRPVLAQPGQQVRVDVALVDLQPGVAQRLGHPAARAQRHVTLVGQPAREHQHAQRPG
jgi:hypothetical protein